MHRRPNGRNILQLLTGESSDELTNSQTREWLQQQYCKVLSGVGSGRGSGSGTSSGIAAPVK